MKKIINTLKFGDGKTKSILLLTFFAGVGTVALFACAFIFGQMILFFGGVICAFITISLAQTFGIEQQEIPEAKLVKDSAIGNILNNVEHTAAEGNNDTDDQVDESMEGWLVDPNIKQDYYTDDVPESIKVGTGEVSKEDSHNNVEESISKEDVSKHKKKEKVKKEKTKKEKTKKEKTKKEKKQNRDTGNIDKASEEKISPKEMEEKLALENATVEEVLETYTKKTIKKTIHKYKVKKDHRMVIIDRCHKLNIHQSPAYIWVSDKDFNILVIDKEPRHLTLPIFSISEITYLKKQPGNEKKDYPLFKGNSIIANLFRPYLPDYSYSTRVDDLTAYKNLYGIGPGIYFTNNSAAELFDLLGARFFVEDKITTSNKANYFFKEIYKCNILLRDNVIDANGYADKVSSYLDDMAHSTISYNEFRDTLNLLIKNKLITQEFASHFAEIRDKISR